MSYAISRTSLMDIQKDIIIRLRKTDIISDINLSLEDYHYIASKIKLLFRIPNDNSIVDDYKLIIVVYWVYSAVFDDVDVDLYSFDSLFAGIPQYKKKYYFNVCMEAFDEYGLNRFGITSGASADEYKQLILKHAGCIPFDEDVDKERIIKFKNQAV